MSEIYNSPKSLNDLKSGDKVALVTRGLGGNSNVRFVVVDRLTPKFIILKDGNRYWRENGRRIVSRGGGYLSVSPGHMQAALECEISDAVHKVKYEEEAEKRRIHEAQLNEVYQKRHAALMRVRQYIETRRSNTAVDLIDTEIGSDGAAPLFLSDLAEIVKDAKRSGDGK